MMHRQLNQQNPQLNRQKLPNQQRPLSQRWLRKQSSSNLKAEAAPRAPQERRAQSSSNRSEVWRLLGKPQSN
jgi:hypothetical protein